MAMFEFMIDDSFVGQAIGPVNGGYLVNLRQTQAQASQAEEVKLESLKSPPHSPSGRPFSISGGLSWPGQTAVLEVGRAP
jgi:hypothetical protein